MKILFAAPFTHSNITFFISNFFKGLAKSAKDLGHEVRVVQTTDTTFPLNNSYEKEFNIFNHFTKNLACIGNDNYMGQALLDEVKNFGPDILFLHVINTYDISEYINQIKKLGTVVVTWLGVHPSVVSGGIHKILKNSDHTLIYDKSYADYYSDTLGIDNLIVVSLGCDTDYFDSITPDNNFIEENSNDISFIGMIDSSRGEILSSLTDYNLGIWSWNINNHFPELKKRNRGVVFGDNMVKTLKSSKIALNIHRKYEVSGGNYRLFEIPASKTFQLVDEKEEISKYFIPGEEIVTFKDVKDLRNKTAYFLNNDNERNEIALAGYRRVKKDHNLDNRLEDILSLIIKND